MRGSEDDFLCGGGAQPASQSHHGFNGFLFIGQVIISWLLNRSHDRDAPAAVVLHEQLDARGFHIYFELLNQSIVEFIFAQPRRFNRSDKWEFDLALSRHSNLLVLKFLYLRNGNIDDIARTYGKICQRCVDALSPQFNQRGHATRFIRRTADLGTW